LSPLWVVVVVGSVDKVGFSQPARRRRIMANRKPEAKAAPTATSGFSSVIAATRACSPDSCCPDVVCAGGEEAAAGCGAVGPV